MRFKAAPAKSAAVVKAKKSAPAPDNKVIDMSDMDASPTEAKLNDEFEKVMDYHRFAEPKTAVKAKNAS